MADFCKQCSIAIFDRDYGDMANLLKPSEYDEDYGALVLCECCGPIVVDIDGKRMSKDFHPECTCAEVL